MCWENGLSKARPQSCFIPVSTLKQLRSCWKFQGSLRACTNWNGTTLRPRWFILVLSLVPFLKRLKPSPAHNASKILCQFVGPAPSSGLDNQLIIYHLSLHYIIEPRNATQKNLHVAFPACAEWTLRGTFHLCRHRLLQRSRSRRGTSAGCRHAAPGRGRGWVSRLETRLQLLWNANDWM